MPGDRTPLPEALEFPAPFLRKIPQYPIKVGYAASSIRHIFPFFVDTYLHYTYYVVLYTCKEELRIPKKPVEMERLILADG